MRYDSGSSVSKEVGKCGLAIFGPRRHGKKRSEGNPLDRVTTFMTINAPAPMILAMFLVVAEKQGADWGKIGGTLNDILKEYIAQEEWIYPRVHPCG